MGNHARMTRRAEETLPRRDHHRPDELAEGIADPDSLEVRQADRAMLPPSRPVRVWE